MAMAATSLWKNHRWQMVTAVLGLLCVMLLVVILSGKGDRAAESFARGQRIAITIADGKITGHPVISEAEKEEESESGVDEESTPPPSSTSETLPGTIPDTTQEEANAAQIQPALPADFVGGQLESQQSVLDQKQPVSADHKEAFPVAVKQEPHTKKVSVAAPATGVNVRNLLKTAPTGAALPVAPIKAVSEKTAEGILPKVSTEGLRPWQAYAKKFSAAANDPLITIIVVGLGMSKDTTQSALHLQEDFTLSFSPYAAQPDLWANHARADGHEVMLDFPVQQADFPASDPGPMGLLSSLKPEENKQRLHAVLTRFSGYTGLVHIIGAAIPSAVIQHCLTDIAARGLLMVESPQSGTAAPANQKQQMGLISFTPDALIDASLESESITLALQNLTEKAKRTGSAIGIARAYPLTLERLQTWQPTLAEQGVKLAPLSALAYRMKQ
jgi:polysaccharide deacetylase 2 family uncharacterized protein YibQ